MKVYLLLILYMLSSVSIFGQGEVKIEKLIENNFIHYFEDVIKTNKADYIIYYNADNYPECYKNINKVTNRINIRPLSFDMYYQKQTNKIIKNGVYVLVFKGIELKDDELLFRYSKEWIKGSIKRMEIAVGSEYRTYIYKYSSINKEWYLHKIEITGI